MKKKIRFGSKIILGLSLVLMSVPSIGMANSSSESDNIKDSALNITEMSQTELDQTFGKGTKVAKDGTLILPSELEFQESELGEYIVKFEDLVVATKEVRSLGSKLDLRNPIDEKTFVLSLSTSQAEKLFDSSNVIYMEADKKIEEMAAYGPTTTHSSANMHQFRQHNINKAHQNGISGEGVDILVVDSGVNQNSAYFNHAFEHYSSYSSSEPGNQSPSNGHGDLVASAIVAKDTNGRVAGIAPDADIWSYRMNSGGTVPTSRIVAGVNWGVQNKVDIINVSFGLGTTTAKVNAYRNAYNNGIPVFNSGGNAGEHISANNAICQYAVCVGSISGSNGARTNTSTWSSAYGAGLDFAGSGSSVVVLSRAGYAIDNGGTSFASPIVASIYALHKSESPDSTMQQILAHMEKSAKAPKTTDVVFPKTAWYEPMPRVNTMSTALYTTKYNNIANFNFSKSKSTGAYDLQINNVGLKSEDIVSVKAISLAGTGVNSNPKPSFADISSNIKTVAVDHAISLPEGQGFLAVEYKTGEPYKTKVRYTPNFNIVP